MHEAALAESLFRMAGDAIAERADARVREVHVLIGALAGVMPDALCFAFDALKRKTPFEKARMVLHTQPVRLSCGGCEAEYQPAAFPWTCPVCAVRSFRVIDGEDVILQSLELEE